MRIEELVEQFKEMRDISEIKDLTYRYWYAVDTKNPEMLKDVFAPGEICIDFDDCPTWHDRDAFVDYYTSLALDPSRQENHYGSSPRIKIDAWNMASGNWRLNMFAYNFKTRTIMRVTGEYDAKYLRVAGEWKICGFRFKRHSLFSEHISEGGEVTVPDFGGVSQDAYDHLYGNQ